MSNSKLVSYTNLTTNCTRPRVGTIKGVAVHCMAGNMTIEQCGAEFQSRAASSHYGIGSDGRIGQYVDENNRAWCTSNAIDHNLVTIEVANTVAADPWPVSDLAYKSLIDLLVDICQRNGIRELLWKGDKSLMGQWDKQNMVVHRWTAPKSCPGNYLYNLHGQIANEVNDRLKGKDDLDMTIAEMIEKVTDEQAYLLMEKANRYLDAIPEPDWSKQEGHWERATKAGVVNGEDPERPMKRDEVIAVLGRKGLV